MRRLLPALLLTPLLVLSLTCGIGASSTPETGARLEGAAPTAASDATAEKTGSWELPRPDLGYNAREGRTLFLHYCATCHGNEGHGDGFNAYSLDPKPRDLSDPVLQQERTDADLEDVIRIGGGASGLSTAMPPWGRTLTPLQIRNLVAFLRNLPPSVVRLK